MSLRILILTAVSSAALALGAQAAEKHRELGAHEHGKGTLNIAIEGQKVAIELESPGMDIVGFEHEANTKAQKAKVKTALTKLKAPLEWMGLPAAAGCSVASAKSELEHEGEEGNGKSDKSGHAHDHDHAEKAGHSAFHATYDLICTRPEMLTRIDLKYFTEFPGSQELAVSIVGPKGQSNLKVTRSKPAIDLAGTM